jgi:hypothetical protein
VIFWCEWLWQPLAVQSSDVLFFLYFTLQFAVGVWTLPAWRRAFEHVSSMRRDTYFLRDLRGKSLV